MYSSCSKKEAHSGVERLLTTEREIVPHLAKGLVKKVAVFGNTGGGQVHPLQEIGGTDPHSSQPLDMIEYRAEANAGAAERSASKLSRGARQAFEC